MPYIPYAIYTSCVIPVFKQYNWYTLCIFIVLEALTKITLHKPMSGNCFKTTFASLSKPPLIDCYFALQLSFKFKFHIFTLFLRTRV